MLGHRLGSQSIMPLRTKKVLPQSKMPVTGTGITKIVPKKAASKSCVYKGKQPAKKVPKPKAGYELYPDRDSQEQRHKYSGFGNCDLVKTLVEDYHSMEAFDTSLTESASGAEVDYVVEKHPVSNTDRTTLFNRRLVSSTPDPERLTDSTNYQPISDLNQIASTNVIEAAQLCQREENASAMLSESEREKLRQHLDGALVEEAKVQNTQLQEQLKKLVNSQKQCSKSGVSSTVVSAGGRPALKGSKISADLVSQRLHSINATARALTKTDMTGLPSQRSFHQKMAVTSVGMSAPSQQCDGKTKESSSTSSADPQGKFKGSDTEAFQHLLHRRTDLPPSLVSTACLGTYAESETIASNVSMGFIPRGNSETVPVSFRTPICASVDASRPLSVDTDEDASYQADTPACSPVGQFVPVQSSIQATLSGSAQVPTQHIPQENWGSLLSRGLVHSAINLSESSEAKNSGISESKFKQSDSRLSKTGTEMVSCTSDGYYMNHSSEVEKEHDRDSAPRVQPPVRSAMVTTCQEKNSTAPAQFNRNNSNFFDTSQLNTNQNTNSRNPLAHSRLLGTLGQRQSQEEDAAGMEASGLAGNHINREVQMVMQEESMKLNQNSVQPQYTCQGPLKVRAAVSQLKHYSEKQGDETLQLLVKQLINTVEWLPQLKENFSLEDYTKPLQMELARQRRRTKNLNVQMKQMEKDRERNVNSDVLLEMLNLETERATLAVRLKDLEETYCQLQKEKSWLMDKLSDMESSHHRQCEAFAQQAQRLQLELKQKEHEAMVSRQEQLQQTNRQNQELERMGLRCQSLQSKLSSADSEKSIMDISIKQKDLQINSLQEALGKMKVAASDVMQHLSAETNRISTLPSYRILQDLIQLSSFSRYDHHTMATTGQCQLDMSGNQRISRLPTGKSADENLYSNTRLTNANRLPSSQQLYPTKEKENHPQARSDSLLKEITNVKETVLMKESQDMRALSPSSLTMSAVAAHNQKQGTMQEKGHSNSVHSWDGVKHQKTELANRSLTCHSYTEPLAVHHKHRHIQQWSRQVESERQDANDMDRDSLQHADENAPPGSSPPSHDKFHNRSDLPTETESIPTLSEVPISPGEPGNVTDAGNIPSLSEVPISESDCGESVKYVKSLAEIDKARDSVTENFNTNSAASLYASSPPTSPIGKKRENAPAAAMNLAERNNSSMTCPDSTVTASASSVTQRDYFHGTELDISMSTIPEDALSTVTGVSVASINTVDNAKFAAMLNTLENGIKVVSKDLRQLKKTFS